MRFLEKVPNELQQSNFGGEEGYWVRIFLHTAFQ